MVQAGDYSSVMHYLKAVKAVNSDDAQKVMAQMKKTPVNDFFLPGTGASRDDGRMVHDMYLFQVKKPSESFGPWDYYKLMATIPGDEGVPAAVGFPMPADQEVDSLPLTK